MSPIQWVPSVRDAFEDLYFLSGIGLFVAACLGLKQIRIAAEQLRLTREVTNTNARREAIKMAAERCQYFAEKAVPARGVLEAEYKRLSLSFLSTQEQWSIQNGEFTGASSDTRLWDAEAAKIANPLVGYLNSLEAFAIPFESRVADDDVGYQEVAQAFCAGVRFWLSALYHLRRTENGRFESTIRTFERWDRRLSAQKFRPIIKDMEEVIRVSEHQKIKPLGSEH